MCGPARPSNRYGSARRSCASAATLRRRPRAVPSPREVAEDSDRRGRKAVVAEAVEVVDLAARAEVAAVEATAAAAVVAMVAATVAAGANGFWPAKAA